MLSHNKISDELKGYQWPASALTANEMAILTEWREKTGLPITQLLKQVVIELNKIKKGDYANIKIQ